MRQISNSLLRNRGIWLAGLLILGICLYGGVDFFQFQWQKKEAEAMIRSYTEQSVGMAFLPAPYNRTGRPADEETLAAKQEENEQFLRQYWCFGKEGSQSGQGEELLEKTEQLLWLNGQGAGAIESATAAVQSVNSFRKLGPCTLEVQFTYAGSVRYIGTVQSVVFRPLRLVPEAVQVYANSRNLEGDPLRKLSPTGDVTAILTREKGSWKIDQVLYANVIYN